MDNLNNFQQALATNGYHPSEIIADGNLHRFPVNGKPHDKAGWYVLFSDGPILAGAFGDWRSGQKTTWVEKAQGTMTDAEHSAFYKNMREVFEMMPGAMSRQKPNSEPILYGRRRNDPTTVTLIS